MFLRLATLSSLSRVRVGFPSHTRHFHPSNLRLGDDKFLPNRGPDNIYRRPEVSPPSSPLSEHDEITFPDAQMPESVIDDYPNVTSPFRCFRQLLMMLITVPTFGFGIAYLSNPKRVTTKHICPIPTV